MVQLLLHRGANIHQEDALGRDILSLASQASHEDVVHVLEAALAEDSSDSR